MDPHIPVTNSSVLFVRKKFIEYQTNQATYWTDATASGLDEPTYKVLFLSGRIGRLLRHDLVV